MKLRRIGVMSAAKLAGLMYALIGLIIGLIVALFSMIGAGMIASAQHEAGMPSWVGAAFGVGAIIVLPILYGILGFIGGAITAAVYNVVAGISGGLELEFDQSGPAPVAAGR